MQDGRVAGLGGSDASIDGVYRDAQRRSVIEISFDRPSGQWVVSETRNDADVGTETYASRSAVEALVATMLDEGYRKE